MDETITTTKRRLLSRLLMGFGAFTLISSIVAGVLLDTLIVDAGGLVVILLGESLSRGSPRAARWARIAMVCYFVVAVLLLIGSIVAPERMHVAGRAVRPGELPYAMAFAGIAAGWALVNLALLSKHRGAFLPAGPKETLVAGSRPAGTDSPPE
jgi:hypothetical protein